MSAETGRDAAEFDQEVSDLSAAIAAAGLNYSLVSPADLVRHFPEESAVDNDAFELWTPKKDYAKLSVDALLEAIRNDGLSPVGPRGALRYAASTLLTGVESKWVVIPSLSPTIFERHAPDGGVGVPYRAMLLLRLEQGSRSLDEYTISLPGLKYSSSGALLPLEEQGPLSWMVQTSPNWPFLTTRL